MRNTEIPSNHESNSTPESHNPWSNMTETAPPFNPNQQEIKEADEPKISETHIAAKMIDILNDKEDECVELLNDINRSKNSLDLKTYTSIEYSKYCKKHHLIDNDDDSLSQWREELESTLETCERRDRLISEALEDLDDPKNANKTLEAIFATKAEKSQKTIEMLASTGTWYNLTDEQRDMYVQRREDYQDLVFWTPHIRDLLQPKKDMDEAIDDVTEPEKNPSDSIDIDAKIEDSQEEIQKREKAIEYYKARDQRDYGGDVLTFTVRLREKQADLHVLKMIRQANSNQSVDKMVSPKVATTTIEKYISDREKIFDKLTEQRSHYAKGSEKYRNLTEKRGKWYREIQAARRVAKQLDLPLIETIEIENTNNTRTSEDK